jgi:hypothetical protein
MRFDDKALGRSVYVIGDPGSGKSRGIEGWAAQLMRQNQGVGVIDPHDQLCSNLVARLAKQGRRIWDKVVLIDPTDPDYTVGFNPLELKPGEIPERKAQFLATVISKIFRADPLITARMQRMLFHTFWLLCVSKLTLIEFEYVLTDSEFRTTLLMALPRDHKLLRYWQKEFPTQDRLITEWTQSSLNKVGPLSTDPDLELILGQQRSSVDFRRIMDEEKILLVNLPKGILTESNSYLMGAFILAQIQLAALSRAEQSQKEHKRFVLCIDEFQNYATDDVHEILAESRKYRLSLIMAHQFYDQLRDQPKLQAAVLNTTGNIACFRISSSDAELFMRDIFAPDIDQVKEIRLRRQPTGINWWPFTTEEEVVWRPLQEIWEMEARHLTMLRDREFWYKRKGPYSPRKLRTMDLPDVVMTPKLQASIDELRARSAALYGLTKSEARERIEQRRTALNEQQSIDPF